MNKKEKEDYKRKWNEAHPDYQREYQEKWREAHPDYQKEYRNTEKNREYQAKWREAHPDYHRKLASGRQQRLKRDVISHYSNGTNRCAFCSFDDIRALSIDHINGGGAKHIRSVHNLYEWLIKNSYPLGFRVLCMNCQWVKRAEKKETRTGK